MSGSGSAFIRTSSMPRMKELRFWDRFRFVDQPEVGQTSQCKGIYRDQSANPEALFLVCSSSSRNRGKFRMELPSSRKPTFVVCDSVSVRFISKRVGSIDSDPLFLRAPCAHLKFSIPQTFLVPLASAMASDRPSGDGIANKISLLERSSTEALPSSVTFSNALSHS